MEDEKLVTFMNAPLKIMEAISNLIQLFCLKVFIVFSAFLYLRTLVVQQVLNAILCSKFKIHLTESTGYYPLQAKQVGRLEI